ncbi:hypothetical protein [Roseovarius sp. EL26]|uniref:hypothetical protein n=1 Tax=Roseovarius sp. EL26 TaxID=2126672 RepID=UPI000EA171D5|nr:hypothetical protein [Roseovarius sp. EL26]
MWVGADQIFAKITQVSSGASSPVISISQPIIGTSLEIHDAQSLNRITHTQLTTAYADHFGYFFNGTASSPPNSEGVVTAIEDLVMFNQKNFTKQILEQYLLLVFQGTLPQEYAISMSKKLTRKLLKNEPTNSQKMNSAGFSVFQSKIQIDTLFISEFLQPAPQQIFIMIRYASLAYNTK